MASNSEPISTCWYHIPLVQLILSPCDKDCGWGITHWSPVTHICVSKLAITGSDNGLSPGWRQTIIWTNAGTLLIGHLGIKFSEILIKVYIFSFKKMHLTMSSGKWRPFCRGLKLSKKINVVICPPLLCWWVWQLVINGISWTGKKICRNIFQDFQHFDIFTFCVDHWNAIHSIQFNIFIVSTASSL